MTKKRANETSFKKGQVPWNKQPRETRKCKQCEVEFEIPIKHRKKACCSKKCADDFKRKDYTRDIKAVKAYNLAMEGKTIKEIAEILDCPNGSIGSYLNRMKFRRFAKGGQSYTSVKNRLLKRDDYRECCVCGFNRGVEVAHIIPASKGGDLTYENTLPLCPNHHYLFDSRKLNEEELLKINKEKERRNAREIEKTDETDACSSS